MSAFLFVLLIFAGLLILDASLIALVMDVVLRLYHQEPISILIPAVMLVIVAFIHSGTKMAVEAGPEPDEETVEAYERVGDWETVFIFGIILLLAWIVF